MVTSHILFFLPIYCEILLVRCHVLFTGNRSSICALWNMGFQCAERWGLNDEDCIIEMGKEKYLFCWGGHVKFWACNDFLVVMPTSLYTFCKSQLFCELTTWFIWLIIEYTVCMTRDLYRCFTLIILLAPFKNNNHPPYLLPFMS